MHAFLVASLLPKIRLHSVSIIGIALGRTIVVLRRNRSLNPSVICLYNIGLMNAILAVYHFSGLTRFVRGKVGILIHCSRYPSPYSSVQSTESKSRTILILLRSLSISECGMNVGPRSTFIILRRR